MKRQKKTARNREFWLAMEIRNVNRRLKDYLAEEKRTDSDG